MIQTAVLSPAIWGDDVWRIDSKLYCTSTSPAGCLYRLAAVVLASRTGSQLPYGTTEHATAATLGWAKAAGGRVASVAAFWAGRLCLCICNGRTDRF